MLDNSPLHGLWCATLTPIGSDGRVERAKFAAHVKQLLERGCDGAMPFGTMGEGPSFSVAERSAGLEALLAGGVPPLRLIAATGCAAFSDTVALTRHALASGCPRCLVLPPFFWKGLSDEAVFRYYASLIDIVGDARLRIYLYHIPQESAVPISLEVVVRLAAAYPEIVAGVKDSAGDFGHSAELLKRAPRLSILTGHEPHLPGLMREGGAGTIGGLANLFPEAVAGLLKPEPNPELERYLQTFLDIVSGYPYVPACKAILAAWTGDSTWLETRPPLLPLAKPEREALFAALRVAGFETS